MAKREVVLEAVASSLQVHLPSMFHYSYLIGKGSSQATLIDSLRIYPNQQRIHVTFSIMPKPDDYDDLVLGKRKIQDNKNLTPVKARITSLCLFWKGFDEVEATWVFAAEVIDGEHENKAMVGIYFADSRMGGFEFVD